MTYKKVNYSFIGKMYELCLYDKALITKDVRDAIETLHGDLTPMYSLIGVVGVLAPVIKHYYLKATQENTKGGVVYDNMMNDNTINSFQETTKSEIEEDCNNVESLG